MRGLRFRVRLSAALAGFLFATLLDHGPER